MRSLSKDKKVHRRTIEIKTAMREFMQSEKAQFCITCKSVLYLTPSHLFKKYALYKQNNPCDKNLIVCQCWKCHSEYELLCAEDRVSYWIKNGFNEIADRMQRVIDGQYVEK